jgi:two-component system, cell cycle response regulator DivK
MRATDTPRERKSGNSAVATAPRRGATGSSQRPLILTIEDNPHDWEIYGKILCYNGYDVMHAADGEEGVQLARRHFPDLVLLDLMLPRLDGLDVCRLLKSEPHTANIRVLVLSSRERKRWEPQARAAGCDGYLEKPMSPVDVLHEVEQAIGRAPLPGTGRPPLYRTPTDAPTH